MKYINKGEEPEEFRNWKALENDDWQPKYNRLQAPQKPIIHHALLREQGYVCCYCGMQIAKNTSHIEHLKPQSIYPELALEYINLIASCQGESEEPPPIPVHCGRKKDDWYDDNLIISPLRINCVDFFRYSAAGERLPTEDSEKKLAAETTIEKLGLNIDKLRRMREQAIDGALLGIEELSSKEIQQLTEDYEQLDSNGQYTPFCASITYILKEYFVA